MGETWKRKLMKRKRKLTERREYGDGKKKRRKKMIERGGKRQ
jgi:hypothetical protein